MLLSYDALADGITADQIVERVVRTVLAPRVTPVQPNEVGTWAS